MCRKDDNSFGFAMGILAGVVGGIVAGVLLAPKSGEESRKDVKEAIDNFREKYSPEIIQAKEQAITAIKDTKGESAPSPQISLAIPNGSPIRASQIGIIDISTTARKLPPILLNIFSKLSIISIVYEKQVILIPDIPTKIFVKNNPLSKYIAKSPKKTLTTTAYFDKLTPLD